jgi:hypothetical protein
MSVQARVRHDRFTLATVAYMQMTAQCRGSTRTDIAKRLQLAVRQDRPPPLQKLLFVLAKDIGDFRPMLFHRCRALSSD